MPQLLIFSAVDRSSRRIKKVLGAALGIEAYSCLALAGRLGGTVYERNGIHFFANLAHARLIIAGASLDLPPQASRAVLGLAEADDAGRKACAAGGMSQ